MQQDLNHLDKIARDEALDPTQSFIVQAPAGSGKTELLIQRFLTLLNVVKKPEEILAITFTKKAANEMRARVMKALKNAAYEPMPEALHAQKTWQLGRAVLEKDQQFNWNLLQNPNQLRIQTIDSLCTYLTKQLPILSHIGAQPDIAQDAFQLYRDAVQEVLAHVEESYEWSSAISDVLLHVDNDLNKLQTLLIRLLQKRDQWLPYIHFDHHDQVIREELEKHFSSVISDHLQSLKKNFPQIIFNQLLPSIRYAADQLRARQSDSSIISCLDLIDFPSTRPQDLPTWQGIAQLLLTKTFSWRKRADEDIGFPKVAELKNAQEKNLRAEHSQNLLNAIISLSDNAELKNLLEELFYLPNPTYTNEQWHILSSLLKILKICAAQLRIIFQQRGKIDFIENTQAALCALGDDQHPTDLTLALDYQIQHILIDEFQDTSSTQYQLLQKLIMGWQAYDGRTLFIVGDPMQSIYRFREAEVGLFMRLYQSGFAHVPLKPLRLTRNFRSTSEIVDWNNRYFEGIFPAFNDVSSGAVRYSESVANHGEDDADAAISQVSLHGFVNNEQEHDAAIVSCIQKLQTEFPNERLAVLVRSRTHLIHLMPQLKKANIAYRAIDIDALHARQIIQDLFSLTCALLHHADRIAWLSMLRAPYCGLTLSDLLIIARQHDYSSIWENIKNEKIIALLSEDGQKRIKRIFPILQAQINERSRSAFRQWIENTWLLLGGPAALQHEDEFKDVDVYFNLLEELAIEQHITRHVLKQKLNSLYAATQNEHCQLDIMTIHSAKGLEFDSVILPHLERKMPNNDKELFAWLEQPLANGKNALLLAPIHATGAEQDASFRYITRRERIKFEHEISRLFYVATTRAKKRLHLFFNAKQHEDNIKIESGSFLQQLWPAISNQQQMILNQSLHGTIGIDEQKPRFIKRLTSDWQNNIKLASKTLSFHHKNAGFQLHNPLPQQIGVVVHQLMQLLSDNGITWWQSQVDIVKNKFIMQALKIAGVIPTRIELAVHEVNRMIENTLADDHGTWILTAKLQAKTEYAITALIKNVTQQLVIDKTFVDENDIRWIIDYKTTTFTDEDLEHFLQESQEKYLEKMMIYAEAMRFADARKIKLGLYFPALKAWKEWDAG